MKKQRDNLVLWDGTKKKSLDDLMTFTSIRIRMKTPWKIFCSRQNRLKVKKSRGKTPRDFFT